MMQASDLLARQEQARRDEREWQAQQKREEREWQRQQAKWNWWRSIMSGVIVALFSTALAWYFRK